MSNGTGPWLVPPGVIVPYGGPANLSPPANWAYCDGAEVQIEDPTYAALYSVIGNSFGGEPPFFNLPDFRGYFLRGVDGGTGRDPNARTRAPLYSGGNAGDNVGSLEEESVQSLGFSFGVQYSSSPTGADAHWGYDMHNIMGGYFPTGQWPQTLNIPFQLSSGSETRPVNVYVYYLICLGVPAST